LFALEDPNLTVDLKVEFLHLVTDSRNRGERGISQEENYKIETQITNATIEEAICNMNYQIYAQNKIIEKVNKVSLSSV